MVGCRAVVGAGETRLAGGAADHEGNGVFTVADRRQHGPHHRLEVIEADVGRQTAEHLRLRFEGNDRPAWTDPLPEQQRVGADVGADIECDAAAGGRGAERFVLRRVPAERPVGRQRPHDLSAGQAAAQTASAGLQQQRRVIQALQRARAAGEQGRRRDSVHRGARPARTAGRREMARRQRLPGDGRRRG